MILFTRINDAIVPTSAVMTYAWYGKLIKKYKNEDLVLKILRYIYFMGHSDSFINEQGLDGISAINKAKQHSDLPGNVDVKDPDILLAINNISEASKDNVKDSINRMLKTLDRTSTLMDKLLLNVDALILKGGNDDLDKASNNLKTIIDLANKVPSTVIILKETLQMYKENVTKKELVKGGENIPTSFEGDNSIEKDD